MSYRTPQHRQQPLEEALEALNAAHEVVLTTHINADGDGAGSEVALAGWLRARGKTAWIVNPTPFPESLRFLLPDPTWVLNPDSTLAKEQVPGADLAVILDTGEGPRIGGVGKLFSDVPALVIDHHPPGPAPLAGVSLRDPGACATGELVFDLVAMAGGPWPPETVRGLYVALLADTGAFRFSNTSSQTHRMVAYLIEKGAEPESLHRSVYGNVPMRKLRLLQGALATLELDDGGELAWMTVPSEAFDQLDARADDLEGLVDYPRSIEGVEVGLLFRETAKGATKVSFRSNGAVDVNVLARRFGGGGHVRASGALVEGPLPRVRSEVLEEVRRALKGRGAMKEGEFRRGAEASESPVPEAVGRLLVLLGSRVGSDTMDRIWIFPPLVRGRKEWGLVAVSCLTGDPAQRMVVTGRYAAELTGTGVVFEPEFISEGSAPRERLSHVMDGVVRRSDLQLGSPREVAIEGDPGAFEDLLRAFGQVALAGEGEAQ